MEDGKIVEQGTHNQLLEKKGYYSNLYNIQFLQKKAG
jgi:ATP-binding cassette subfamily B protein